jgi:hypothetical protein
MEVRQMELKGNKTHKFRPSGSVRKTEVEMVDFLA